MKQKLDKILVVDIEATCWEGKPPADMTNDIIEIGICLLDIKTGEVSDNMGILVIPERSAISAFCTKLTTITPELINEKGISFKDACALIRQNYQSDERIWASYGAYDLKQFQRQCFDMSVAYPFSQSHFNVKTLFTLKKKLNREPGMSTALELLDIPLEGIHHRGVDDALNIAKIFRWILNN